MFKIFNKFIYSNFNLFLIRFTENKNYIQGIFYTNNSKLGKIYNTTVERQSGDSTKTILNDNLEIQNLEYTDDNTLLKKVQLTSK